MIDNRKSTPIGREAAEALAIQTLGFIASDPALLPRFLAITGIDAGQIRAAAMQPGFLAGVIDTDAYGVRRAGGRRSRRCRSRPPGAAIGRRQS